MPVTARRVEYLSPPEAVSMGNAWFDIANPGHFWIRRRFEVLRKITRDLDWPRLTVAEVGCGNGLLQRQCEDQLGLEVDGFDLNEAALLQAICRRSRSVCYNVHDRQETMREKYHVIFLFDVLEHIDDQAAFLASTLFHLQPGGRLIINVPADQALFSRYDEAAGHVRRYRAADLQLVVEQAGLHTRQWTYWGLPLRPLLTVRKFRLRNVEDHDAILKSGFDSRGGLVNNALWLLSQLEIIPQHRSGSSLMLVATKNGTTPASTASSQGGSASAPS